MFRSPCFELGAVGGRSQLVRLLDKSMSTLDSQHNTLAETTSARFGQLQRQFDMGGTVDDLRGRIVASEERTTGAVEAAAARTAAAERKMGIYCISPSNQGGELHKPPPKLVEACKPLHPLEFGLLYLLTHKGIGDGGSVSVGPKAATLFSLLFLSV